MKLDISGVRSRGSDAGFSYEPDLSQAFPAGVCQASVSGAVKAGGGLPNGDCGLITLDGALTARLTLTCDRCAEPFERDKTLTVSCAVARSWETNEDHSDDVLICDDDRLELDDVFIPALVLDMDMKTLCREDCKGLCPRCGQNLNRQACACS